MYRRKQTMATALGASKAPSTVALLLEEVRVFSAAELDAVLAAVQPTTGGVNALDGAPHRIDRKVVGISA